MWRILLYLLAHTQTLLGNFSLSSCILKSVQPVSLMQSLRLRTYDTFNRPEGDFVTHFLIHLFNDWINDQCRR